MLKNNELVEEFKKTLSATVKSIGKKAGVSINPATPVSTIFEVLDIVDLVLVMSVNPGFGGQKFIPRSITKIKALREAIDSTGRNIDLEVDGGIDPVTAKDAIKAGADVLVAGSATFKGGKRRYAANIRSLRGTR